MAFDLNESKIFVAGHRGMVGSAVCRQIVAAYPGARLITRTRKELDLVDQAAVYNFIDGARPDLIIDCAAVVGGINANSSRPADFILSNLIMQNNIIMAAHLSNVTRLVFLGSSCIYPKFAANPISESSLLTGPLEETNQWYAIAKIAGLKACAALRRQYGRQYISVMPSNLYGPGDSFDLVESHVLPALIRKVHEANSSKSKRIVVWGTGTPLREFLFVDDLARAILLCAENYDAEEHINVGGSSEVSIAALAQLIAERVGFSGELFFDRSKPDGTPRKVMDNAKIAEIGWKPIISLEEGIDLTYAWYLRSLSSGSVRGHETS